MNYDLLQIHPYWTYDYWFSPNYEIKKDTFVIGNDQMRIRSTNRDDLLNLKHYQQLNDLANNCQIKKGWWIYFPQDQVLQLTQSYQFSFFNIKLTKPIDQYDQNQLNTIGKFMTNLYDLIIKDDQLDWKQVDDQWKQGFGQYDVETIGINFDLNDLNNPKIVIRWWDEIINDCYQNNYLKQVLKDNSPLLKFLDSNDFQANFLNVR